MKNMFLSTVAALAIVAAPVSAFAQKEDHGASERSGGASDAGGARSGGDAGGSRMERSGGGAERPSAGGGAERPSPSDDNSKTGVGGSDASKPTPAPEKSEPKPNAASKPDAKPNADMKPGADGKANSDMKPGENKPGQDQKSGGNPDLEKNRPGEPTKSDGEMDKSGSDKSRMDDKSRTETDKSRSGSHTSVNISTEQRTSIRQTITTSSTSVKKVSRSSFGDVSISVGTRIPRERITSVTIERLPPKIVEIVPEYRDYSYFVLDDGTIVIVDPDTYEIVYVIDA